MIKEKIASLRARADQQDEQAMLYRKEGRALGQRLPAFAGHYYELASSCESGATLDRIAANNLELATGPVTRLLTWCLAKATPSACAMSAVIAVGGVATWWLS